MKLVYACLYAEKEREISFHPFGSPMKLVLSCLCAEKSEKVVFISVEVL